MVDSIAVDLTNSGQLQRFRLQDGDSVYIPQRLNFVSVRGAVKNPGGHAFAPGRRAKFYLRQSGGFQTQAARRSLVVRYANGRSAEVRYAVGLIPIYPRVFSNSVITVLPKEERDGRSDPAQVAAISSIITSVSSMALGVFYLLRN
jgi:protein involved in polysaccharide export with SLBB domain